MNQNLKHSLVTLLTDAQAEIGKTDAEISRAMGSHHDATFTRIKDGMMKLPIPAIPSLAQALSLDAAHLLRITLAESMPELLQLLDTLATTNVLTGNERELIDSYRRLSKGEDVRPLIIDGNSLIALVVA